MGCLVAVVVSPETYSAGQHRTADSWEPSKAIDRALADDVPGVPDDLKLDGHDRYSSDEATESGSNFSVTAGPRWYALRSQLRELKSCMCQRLGPFEGRAEVGRCETK